MPASQPDQAMRLIWFIAPRSYFHLSYFALEPQSCTWVAKTWTAIVIDGRILFAFVVLFWQCSWIWMNFGYGLIHPSAARSQQRWVLNSRVPLCKLCNDRPCPRTLLLSTGHKVFFSGRKLTMFRKHCLPMDFPYTYSHNMQMVKYARTLSHCLCVSCSSLCVLGPVTALLYLRCEIENTNGCKYFRENDSNRLCVLLLSGEFASVRTIPQLNDCFAFGSI